MARVTLHWSAQGSLCISLMPQTVETWLRLLEDVWGSIFLRSHRTSLLDVCEQRMEFRHVSIDCTLRVLRRVRGQADYRASAETRAMYPIGDSEALRRVLTVIGTDGALLAVGMVPDESQEAVVASLSSLWSSSQLAQVQTVATDAPGPGLYEVL